jgi:hypothetical protein
MTCHKLLFANGEPWKGLTQLVLWVVELGFHKGLSDCVNSAFFYHLLFEKLVRPGDCWSLLSFSDFYSDGY